MGCPVPDDFKIMEIAMGGTDGVLQVSCDDSEGDVYNERDRVAQFHGSEDHEEPSVVPVVGCSYEASVHGLAEHLEKVDDADT